MKKRKNYHFAVEYQYKKFEKNLATIDEERLLGVDHHIQSCQFQSWMTFTMAMTCSLRENDESAKVEAIRHLIKMIIRKHGKRKDVKIVQLWIDREDAQKFYNKHIDSLLIQD